MYSETIIVANLEEFARREKWTPTYHSIAQIDEFKAYIDSITKKDTNGRSMRIELNRDITAQRAKDIRRWIENEQALCCFDSNYFETRYAWICDEKGDIFKFSNRKAQEIFDNIIAEFDAQQVAIELLILKARQQGITTKTALKFLHRMLFLPHTQAVMGSVDEKKSELISRIIETCIERTPWWLLPQRTTDRIKLIGFVNGSILSVQSGSQATGIAQGWTPTCVHVSEIGDIPNPKKTLEEGLLRATHPTRKLFQVWEGTGSGNTGYQADKWRAAKEDWPLGKSRLCPVFIPWPAAPDLYPEADWIRKFPVPGGFRPLEVTRKHVQRCELFIRSTPYLAKVMGKSWKMPVEQQWFWEFNFLEAAKSHTQKIWLSQMPADDYEALQGKNDLVFDAITIDTARDQSRPCSKCGNPESEHKSTGCRFNRGHGFQAYGITGDTVDDGFELNESEVDYDKERIRVTWRSHRGQTFEWVMVPLLPFDEDDERKSLDKVLVFEEPNMEPGKIGAPQNYSIGVDTADGLDQDEEDRTVVSGVRSMSGKDRDVQVFELSSKKMNAPQTVAFAACLAAWYGENTVDARGVKFAIEQRERPGDDCQLQLKLMGFNFHHLDISYDSKVIKENKGRKEGIYMRPWSRGQIITRFTDAVRNGWYLPKSPFLINELSSLERKLKNGKSRVEHQSGKHDDRVLAAAHSYWTRHHLENLAERSQKRYAQPVSKRPELDLSWCRSREVSVGDFA
jgi:hypothetical protein